MNEQEISTPAELDTALRARALRRRADLKKVAAGRSFRWAEVVGALIALLLVIAGLAAYFERGDGMIQIVLGFAMVASFAWSHHARQLAALVELVDRLEDERGTGRKTPG